MSKEYIDWIELRNDSVDEFGDKLCYCGHTDVCGCGNPDITLFNESVRRKTIKLNDPKNGWSPTGYKF